MYGPQNLARLWSDESGISSVEYVLLLAFVAFGILATSESLTNAILVEITENSACNELDSGC